MPLSTGEESEIRKGNCAYLLIGSISWVSISYGIMKPRNTKGMRRESVHPPSRKKPLVGHDSTNPTREKVLPGSCLRTGMRVYNRQFETYLLSGCYTSGMVPGTGTWQMGKLSDWHRFPELRSDTHLLKIQRKTSADIESPLWSLMQKGHLAWFLKKNMCPKISWYVYFE